MVLAGLSFTELNTVLKENGYYVESDQFWEDHDRIILKKDNDPVVILQFKTFYPFPFVVKFLRSLGIDPPVECQKPYDQWMEQLKKQQENPPPKEEENPDDTKAPE